MKTAVEWLENQIKNSKHYFNLMKEIQSRGTVAQSNIFEQAKKMEKKQMKKAYNHDRPNLLCYEKGTAFKEYYNYLYKKQ